ncbi:MAG: TonB-dependent receptor [Bacteroidaceae bacterium]|nr:TonB-dependent receptor [Bacteroidaceae bacterium]
MCIAVISPSRAEIIRGRVIDAETREVLPGVDLLCSGAYKQNDRDIRYNSHLPTDSLGRFLFFSNTSGKITARLIGYYPKEVNYIAISDNDRDTVDLGDILLKPSEVMMKALEVKGRMRRFTMSGDTIVFHPEAFHLEKGARLEELIAQLPGVEMNGNDLTFNGKPIRVVMNGEKFLGGPGFYNQLPAEAVETIKAYNKASEFSERTGRDDGREDMVLDLKIKKSFLDKFYGDVSGAYQTPKHYDAEATVQRLSESHPMMLTASVNDLAKQRRVAMGRASATMSKGFGREQYGAAGYQHNWNRKEAGQTLRNYWSVSGGVAHDDSWAYRRKDTENFFPGETYNYTASSNYQRSHVLNPNAEARFRRAFNVKNTVSLGATFSHYRLRDRSEYRAAQFDNDPYDVWRQPLAAAFDSLGLPGMLLRNRTREVYEKHSTIVGANASWTHYFKTGSVSLSASVDYNESLRNGLTERNIEHFVGDGTRETLKQSTHTPTNGLTTLLTALGRKWVHRNVLLNVTYRFRDMYQHDVEDFFADDMRDHGNSYDDRYRSDIHSINLGSTINLNAFQLLPKVSWEAVREHEHYGRGNLDTTATRHALLWRPELKVKWKVKKTSALELSYDFRTTQPKLIETLHYRDDRDPLYIREGNSGLRNTHSNTLSLSSNNVNSKRQRMVDLALNFQNNDRVVQYVQTYNPLTSVYTIHPEMVRGGRQEGVKFGYDQGLGNEFRLKSTLNIRFAQTYSYLTRTDETGPLQRNRCNNFSPSEDLTLSYDHLWLKCSVFTIVGMNQLRFSNTSQQNTTLWNERVGADITLEWEHLTINSRLTEYFRHGYLIDAMNNNYLIWNASVTWKFLKNKARLRLEANDILNQIDTFYTQQTAYQNIYTWRNQRHHFVNLSFTYHFDAKKK